MDAGAVAGKGEAVFGDEPVLKGGEDGGETENLLEPFFIMERECLMFQGVSGHGVGNAGMLIRKLLPFARFFISFPVLVFREKVFPASSLDGLGLCPESVHEVEVRAKGRKGMWGAANERGKQGVSPEFLEPGGKTGETQH